MLEMKEFLSLFPEDKPISEKKLIKKAIKLIKRKLKKERERKNNEQQLFDKLFLQTERRNN